jgi:titin
MATTAAPGQIDLVWTNNSPNVTSFSIWRQGGGSSYAPIAAVGGGVTSYIDTGLSPDTVYTYRVRALTPTAGSGWSNEASAATPIVPPAAPSNLTATTASSTQINLAWTVNSNNETGIAVWRQSGGGWVRVGVRPPHSSSFSDTGLTPATTYTYEVRAINNYFPSAWSNQATATTSG